MAKNRSNPLGAKNNDSTSEKQAIVIFYTEEYRKCGKSNSKNDSRPCIGASSFLKSIDFWAFEVNVKTIAPTQKLYQSGHAIWWGDMPRILYTFFDAYDFSGKTIAPFCTSGGSGLSGTPGTIAEMETGATVLDGLHISDSSADNAESAVAEWLTDIGQD